ncbi:arylsulfatase [Chitinophaga sp. MM2321]|uniref:sulfatase family protein n=1 Tax=Chitinophaga sp. MM2321 TaxID=3137178 RepID=UPI0032D59DEE
MNYTLKPFYFLVIIWAIIASSCTQKEQPSKPNIIIMYADDLGYGDVGCYGATRVKTPHIDQLASNGLVFTDAHCTAATCTPSRFSMLTGSYAFRNNAAILPGDAPLLIRPGTPTLPGMLQQAGYTTAVIGKWHLGLGDGTIDWNGDISPGPLEIGFDYSFLVPATLDRVPCVFVENRRVFNLDPADPIEVNYDHKIGSEPTGLESPGLLKVRADTQHSNTIINGISRIGYTSGGKSAWWKDEEIATVLVNQTKAFLHENKDNPFFLFLSYTDIHVPREPHPRFKGATTMGRRGDAIAQMDWTTGEVMKMLDKLGLTHNTLVIFTSDNGPVLDDGYEDESAKLVGDHKPAGPFKGGKYSAYEGGTRVPTIVSWPAKIKPGISNSLVNQVDFYASFAALTGQPLNEQEAPDSYNMLPALLGQSLVGRQTMLEESFTLALRNNNWKFIAPQTKGTPAWLKDKDVETGLTTTDQLFELESDKGEVKNVIDKYPEVAEKMKKMLKDIEMRGTRPGYKN